MGNLATAIVKAFDIAVCVVIFTVLT